MARSESRTTEFGRRLKAARGERFTQKEVSTAAKIPLTTYQGYEQGRSLPTAERLTALCRILEVSPETLLPHNWTVNSS